MNRIDNLRGVPIDPRIGRVDPAGPQQAQRPARTEGASFRQIFQQEVGRGQGLRFSAHAQDRLASRHIQLPPETLSKLTEAIDRAADKGARDALVLLPGASRREDLALLVSVTNRTVITAMDGERIRENIFTNIDSAVVLQ